MTHPFLSTDDEFADFETWDFGNFNSPSDPKENEMLRTEYARSALKLGLQWTQTLGANPFKFGMIGSTDTHTSMSTVEEDNFFGKWAADEPSPVRWKHVFMRGQDGEVVAATWNVQAGGLLGIWARENTRESLFDAMARKEVYGTTGTRITAGLCRLGLPAGGGPTARLRGAGLQAWRAYGGRPERSSCR